MNSTEQTDNTNSEENASVAYQRSPELQVLDVLRIIEGGLQRVADGAEALTALGGAVESAGNEPGAAVSYVAEKHETDVREHRQSFEKLRDLIYAVAPAVKVEGDRIDAKYRRMCGLEASE